MSRTKEQLLAFALKAETADWGDIDNAVVTGAGDQVIFDEATLEDGTEFYTDESKNDSYLPEDTETSAYLSKIGIKSNFYVNGLKTLLGALMPEVKAPIANANPDYKSYFFGIAPDGVENKGISKLVKKMGPSDVAALFSKFTEFKISGATKSPLNIESTGVCHSLKRDATRSESQNWTKPDNTFKQKYHLRNCVSSKVAEFGGAFAELKQTMFEIAVNTGLFTDGFTTKSGAYREEPLDNDNFQINPKLTVYKHETDIWNTRANENKAISAYWEFVRGDYSLKLFIPKFQITADPAIELGDGGQIDINGTCMRHEISEDPFSTERTINGTEITLDKAYPFYCILTVLEPD